MVAGGSRRERLDAEDPTAVVDNGGDVELAMGVDPAVDALILIGHTGACLSFAC